MMGMLDHDGETQCC